MKTKKIILIILITTASVALRAQAITCDFFCVTDIAIETDTSLVITIAMNGTSENWISYPYVSALTDISGDTIAGSTLDLFGQVGGHASKYTVNKTGNTLPVNFKGTAFFKYHFFLNSDSAVFQTCALPYPCVATKTDHHFSMNEITIYPVPLNPASSLHIDGNIPVNSYFKVMDLTGREVQQQPIVNSTLQLDESNLPAGMYLYMIGDGKMILKTGKLVVNDQMK